MTKTYEQLLEEAKAVAVEVRKAYGMDDVTGLLRQHGVDKITDLRTEQLPPFIESCRLYLVKDKVNPYEKLAQTFDGVEFSSATRAIGLHPAFAAPYGDAETDTTSQQVESLAQSDIPQPVVNIEGIKVTDRASAQALVDLLQKKYDLLDDNAILRDLMEKMEERHGEEFNAFFEATISAIMEAMNLDELRVSTAAVIYNAAITSGLVCSEEPGALVYRRVTPADVIDPNEKVIIKEADVVIPDECVASGQSCEYAADGPNGEMQCKYCGKEQGDTYAN